MEIVNCDALEYIDTFADNTFDLVILDPDYNDWDALLKADLLRKVMRVTKETGNILAFTKQPFDYNLRLAVDKWFRREIVWTFENGGAWCSPKMPLISSQKIYWLAKGKRFYFNPRTGIPYSQGTRDFKRSTKVFGGYAEEGRQFTKSEEGVWLRDHLHYNKPNSGKLPAKPQEMIDIFVRCFSPAGGLVLDPFAGSGTTINACERLCRDAYASENNKERAMLLLDRYFSETAARECER